MADSRLRRLSRQASQGDAQAHGRFLVELVRIGDLPRARVEIAAFLAHPGALAALSKESYAPTRRRMNWVKVIPHWGREPVVRVALSAARIVMDADDVACVGDDPLSTCLAGLRSVESWLTGSDPSSFVECERHQSRLQDMYNLGAGAFSVVYGAGFGELRTGRDAAKAVHACLRTVTAPLPKAGLATALRCADRSEPREKRHDSNCGFGKPQEWPDHAFSSAAVDIINRGTAASPASCSCSYGDLPPRVFESISRDLLAWALPTV